MYFRENFFLECSAKDSITTSILHNVQKSPNYILGALLLTFF